ncbi:FKBP-type peptidyl-prolyl cis-trans isomerase [Eisenibacter elegans]|uniref:FKBP-type peptidyl-prolyl cis-trans isomerase n=1 Tax=Eisenibacter elegans TaxID=997 RepID=UPI000410DAB9|nr:FKBP-type peptidyl-prolyl cis-trans isomerase [Eisenibacter elegans]
MSYFRLWQGVYLGSLVLLLWACGSTQDPAASALPPRSAKAMDNGLKYSFFGQSGQGRKAQEGEFITYHLVIENEGRRLRSTYEELSGPIQQKRLQTPKIKGTYDEILLLLSEGDSVAVWIPADSLARRTNTKLPQHIPSGTTLKYIIKVLKIESAADIKASNEQNMRAQRDEDLERIQQYIAQDSVLQQAEVKKTDSGLHYALTQIGGGKKPKTGDTVSIHYVGRLLTGKVFDSSYEGSPLEFPVGVGMVIKGWDEGIMLLQEGDKARMLIPSTLAYGIQGDGLSIPPMAVLLYDVEVVKVK